MDIRKIILEEVDEFDWIREIDPTKGLPRNYVPSVGDTLICIPGFMTEEEVRASGASVTKNDLYGGAGYKPGKIITVRGIKELFSQTGGKDRNVVWVLEGPYGVYVDALAPYNE